MTQDPSSASPSVGSISPNPSDEEVAAIVAAVELAWPRPQAAVVDDPPMRWRFSGRWWSRPVPTRRARPS